MNYTDSQIIRGSLTGAYRAGFADRAEGRADPAPPTDEQGRWLYMNGWEDAGHVPRPDPEVRAVIRPETLTRTSGGEPIETPELVADWDEAIRLLRQDGHRYTVNAWMLLVPTIAGRMWLTPAEVLDRFDGCRCCGAGPRDLTRRTGSLMCERCAQDLEGW